MKDACEQSIDRLVSWGEPRLVARDRDLRQAAEAALALAEQFSEHLKLVNTWPEKEPTPQAKTDTINEIIKLRDTAIQLMHRFGATL